MDYTWLAPPVVGAFIGYMTNHIAIRMLFRPLRPWRLFGLRLPLTPGVIPAKRHDLAANIGEMVGSHLLTSSDIQRALADETFQHDLGLLLDSRVDDLLHRKLGPLPTLIPERFRPTFHAGVNILRWRAQKFLHASLGDQAFSDRVSPVLEQAIDDLLSRRCGQLLAAEDRQQLLLFLEQTINRLLHSAELEQWLAETLAEKCSATCRSETSLADLLSPRVTDLVLDAIAAETPALLRGVADLLQQPSSREKLTDAIVKAINGFMAQLGPMAAMAGAFISPDTIRRHVAQYLETNGHQIAGWLFDHETQEKIAATLRDKTKQWLSTPLAQLLTAIPEERRGQLLVRLKELILAAIRHPGIIAGISSLLQARLTALDHARVADVLEAAFTADQLRRGRDWLAAEIISLIRSPGTKKIIDSTLVELVDNRLLGQPLGALADLLPKEVSQGISGYLLEQINGLLAREVPSLMAALNIKQIVARKVDSLDLLHLEALLLSIMEEQFKYINLFGGLLGFLIGCVNLLLL